MSNKKVEEEKLRNERIEETGQVTLDKNSRSNSIHLITIIGEIEGHDNLGSNSKTTKYEHVLPLLAKLEESGEVRRLKTVKILMVCWYCLTRWEETWKPDLP